MRTWLLIVLMLTAQVARAEMWKCVDQDGNTRYTNVKADAKGCKALNLEPINTAPATRAQQKPANFPSVDNDTQKQRDAGRRKILEQELAQEQQQLEAAKKQLAEQKDTRYGSEKNYARVEERLKPLEDQVKLHESNVESLRKEIANTR
jgi:septal ring factor EnvC (AmiA/AmiB activator)